MHSEDVNERMDAVIQLYLNFADLPDKEQAWKDLLELRKDSDSDVQWKTTLVMSLVFPSFTNGEQLSKDLLTQTKNKNYFVRWGTKWSLFNITGYFLENKNYEKAYQCFYGASTKYTFKEYINPDSFYYLCRGFGYYYHGRTIINELSNIENPKEYTKSLKAAVRLFAKSNKYIEKSDDDRYDTDFFPICLNIYSAYYEYNLSFQKLDSKRVAKVQKYLDEASKQCQIIGTEKGQRIVKTFEKLAEALMSRLKQIELEKEKNKVSGIGEKVEYEPFVDKSRKVFEKHIAELESSLDEIELPIIKKIAEHERKKLKNLKLDKVEKSEPTNRVILNDLAILLTISGFVWAISYAILENIGHITALWESISIFGISFIILLGIYLIKR